MLNHLSQVGALRWVAYKNLAGQFFFHNNCCTWLIKIVKGEGIGFFLGNLQNRYSIHVLIRIAYKQSWLHMIA